MAAYFLKSILIVGLFTSGLSISSQGQTVSDDGPQLRAIMQEINTHYASLQQLVRFSEWTCEQRLDGLKAAMELRFLFNQASRLVPPKVLTLPEDEQASLMGLYRDLMEQTQSASRQVADQFHAGTPQEAARAMRELRRLRVEGHTEFIPGL